MGVANFLIEGGSGTGKTTVCEELQRRGYQAIHGDRELRAERPARTSEHHLSPVWDVAKVDALLADQDAPVTFFCGGCRNLSDFVDRFDGIFSLEVADLDTVLRRIDERVRIDPDDWGGRPEEREIIARLHRTRQVVPQARPIDATAPVGAVVDEILRLVGESTS